MEERQGGGAAPPGSPGGPPPPTPPLPRSLAAAQPLSSYVSEPPSTLAALKAYAQELAAAAPQGGAAGAATELDVSPRVLQRPTHFQLGPTIGGGTRPAASPARAALRTSIGWATSAGGSPGSGGEGVVLEHRVAGDLIMPADTLRAAAAARRRRPPAPLPPRRRGPQRASGDSGHAAAAPAADVAQRSCEGSGQPGGGAATQDGEEAAGEDGDKDELESLDFEGREKAWWRRRSFWLVAGPLIVGAAFLVAGIFLVVYGQDVTVGDSFQLWRICFFISGLVVIWWIGKGFMDGVVYGVERTMFTYQNALYYCYAVRRPAANVIRAGLATGWWAIMMTAWSSDMNSTLRDAYYIILKLLGCLVLFMTANLLKVLFAKMMASKFNQRSHYEKMHEALKREYLLHLMLQPRQRYTEFDELEDGEEDGEGGSLKSGGSCDGLERATSAPAACQPARRSTRLRRLFGASASAGPRAELEEREPLAAAPRAKSASRRLTDVVMFWRSHDDLKAIDEEGEGDGEGEGGAQRHLPPPGAVAIAMPEASLCGGADARRALDQPPASPDVQRRSADGATPRGRLAVEPGAPWARCSGDPSATPQPSPPCSPTWHASPGKPASPSKPPLPPASKLLRHRSDALEAAGMLGLAGLLPPPALAPPPPTVQPRDAPAYGAPRPASLPGGRAPLLRTPSNASRATQRPAAPAPTPAAAKQQAELKRVASSVRSSRRQLMALRMSKMEKYIRKYELEVTFKDALSRTERSEAVTSELEARKLGFYLYHNLRGDWQRDHVLLADLEEFLSEADAKAGWDMLDEDGDGRVSVQECCGTVLKIFVERRNLAASLKDARTIVATLQTLIGVVLHILFGFLYLVIWQVDIGKTWAGFASLVLSLSFIFGNSIKTTYENVVFLFVVHPFDVGDALLLNGEQCRVEEIQLGFTVIVNPFGQRVFYPNDQLRATPFINVSASAPRGEAFKVLVDLDTPPAAVDAVRAAADGVLRAAPREFTPGSSAVNLAAADNPLKMTLSVWFEFSHSGADLGRMARARTKMYTALSEALVAQGVRYTWPATAGGGGLPPPGAGGVVAAAAMGAAPPPTGAAMPGK